MYERNCRQRFLAVFLASISNRYLVSVTIVEWPDTAKRGDAPGVLGPGLRRVGIGRREV